MANRDLHQALQANDIFRVWFSVQALLIAVGNVSKLLWPIRERIKGRGEQLRASLLVEEDSPLKDRILRDHFEHFDERIDMWAKSSENLVFADSNIGTTPGVGILYSFAEGDHLRNIYRTDDPSQFALTFKGECFFLPPIIEAIERLADKAEAQSRGLPGRGRL